MNSEAAADRPPVLADPAWDEAFLRVQSYLRAYGLESPLLLNDLTAGIIREARCRAGTDRAAAPVTLAMDVTQAWIGAWFKRAGQEIDWANGRTRAQGRLALILADLPGRWASHFLSAGPVPPRPGRGHGVLPQIPARPLNLRLSSSMPAASPRILGFLGIRRSTCWRTKRWLPVRALGLVASSIVGFLSGSPGRPAH